MIDSYPGVEVSAVIGVPDEKNGEVPIAYVELEEEADGFDLGALKKYLREQLANYKIPRQIHLIEELPKNATGKVLKRVLKENLKQECAHE